MAATLYLKQCWLIISDVVWYWPGAIAWENINFYMSFKCANLRLLLQPRRDQSFDEYLTENLTAHTSIWFLATAITQKVTRGYDIWE